MKEREISPQQLDYGFETMLNDTPVEEKNDLETRGKLKACDSTRSKDPSNQHESKQVGLFISFYLWGFLQFLCDRLG